MSHIESHFQDCLDGLIHRCASQRQFFDRIGMRENWNLSIAGNGILLVPYRHKFVAKYHSWMKDPFLLESTASEPLSLDEEYEMQRLWRDDPRKCTFIVLAKPCDEISSELDCMAGDVNLFMNDRDDKFNAEIEVMIAEPRHRRHGFASEALKLMIHYATTQLEMTRFFAKIGAANLASIALFKRSVAMPSSRQNICSLHTNCFT